MKIGKVSGCIHSCYTIDDKIIDSLNDKDIINARKNIIKFIQNNNDVITIEDLLNFVLDLCGDYEYDEKPCECCGDIVEYYKLDIN